MKRIIALLIFCFIATSGAYASRVISLATITSDADVDTAYFKLEVNKYSDIIAIRKEKFGPEKQLLESLRWAVLDNISEIVFASAGSRKVVVVRSPNFSSHNGGEIQLDLLRQGKLFGKDVRWNEPFKLDLVREGDNWILRKNGTRVSYLYFKANRTLGKAVGIANIYINKIRAKSK